MGQGTARLDSEGILHLGPRVIPIPTSVSATARRFLATPVPDPVQPEVSATAAADSGCAAFSPDCRMPPDHPFPGAVDDTLAV